MQVSLTMRARRVSSAAKTAVGLGAHQVAMAQPPQRPVPILLLDFFTFLGPGRGFREDPLPPPKPFSESVTRNLWRPLAWLKTGVLSGFAASATFSGVCLAVAGTFLSTSAAFSSSVVAAVGAGVMVGIGLQQLWSSKKEPRSASLEEVIQKSRLERMSQSLAQEAKVPPPEIKTATGSMNFGMVDRWGRPNILLFDPRLASQFSERELKGIVAHELAHADRSYTFLTLATKLLSKVAELSVIFASLRYYQYLGLGGGGILVPVLAAAGTGALFALIERTFTNVASRANELLTDIRGAKMSQDPVGLMAGLERIRGVMGVRDEPRRILRYIRATHPTFAERRHWLSKWFQESEIRHDFGRPMGYRKL